MAAGDPAVSKTPAKIDGKLRPVEELVENGGCLIWTSRLEEAKSLLIDRGYSLEWWVFC